MVDDRLTDNIPWLYYKLTSEGLKMAFVPSEDLDQPGHLPIGHLRTCHFVGFVMRRLTAGQYNNNKSRRSL